MTQSILLNNNHIIQVPEEPMAYEYIEGNVKTLRPNENYALKATTTMGDETKWSSRITIQADSEGNAKVSEEAFDQLFVTMKSENDEQPLTFPNLSQLNITLEVLDDNETIEKTNIVRNILSPDVERREIRENGLVGTLFTPKGEGPFPGVMVAPGAQGGIPENTAALLASQGFACFALGYCGFEGQSPWLFNIPIEYFQDAFSFLGEQDKVDGDALGFVANSKGAELALLYSSTFPDDVKAVVGYVPPSATMDLVDDPSSNPKEPVGVPCWVKAGKAIQKHFPFRFAPEEGSLERGEGTYENPISSAQLMYKQITTDDKVKKAFEEAAIKVENMKAPLLMFSAEDDQTIPSTYFADKVIERLDKMGSTIERTHIAYPEAGHPIGFGILPGLPAWDLPFNTSMDPEKPLWWGSGGTVEGNAFAARDSFARTVAFLNKHLKNG